MSTPRTSSTAVKHRRMYVVLMSVRLYPCFLLLAKSDMAAIYRDGTSSKWQSRYAGVEITLALV
uniref:Uncharacterized protein n=1 Tax=Arundo donax TaxID=35708 RepID=A0A0A8ZTF1_ARUDO